jgi:hypothetical protein
MTTEEKILQEFGAELFSAVFSNPRISSMFEDSLKTVENRDNVGLRLVLRVDDPELALLPWEYMCDLTRNLESTNYICLRSASPLVRLLGSRNANVTAAEPVRILGMISNPSGEQWERLDVEAERYKIEQIVNLMPAGKVEFSWVSGGRLDDLFRAAQAAPWHIFHFIGHGGTHLIRDNDGNISVQGYVVMQDGKGGSAEIPAHELGLAFNYSSKKIKLAVLNCCDSGKGTAGVSSVGAALVAAGFPSVIAMQYAITNDIAVRFAGEFYKQLLAGQCLEEALTLARRFVRFASAVEWGIPVLLTAARSCVFCTSGSAQLAPASEPEDTIVQRHEAQSAARDELRKLFK